MVVHANSRLRLWLSADTYYRPAVAIAAQAVFEPASFRTVQL